LNPGGLLIISTPNRLTFSPGLDEPRNLFHTKEFTADEITGLLTGCGFAVERMLGVHAGERLAQLDREHGGSFVAAQLARPPAEWGARLRADVAGVAVPDFTIDDAAACPIDESLDLLVLARHQT
jgi:hypothetical protein